MARWYILSDAINFQSSLDLEFEYGANKPYIISDYASVAFFYLK